MMSWFSCLTKLAFEHSFRLIARYTVLLDKLLNVLFSCSFGGIGNRLFFNDCYSFLCLLALDGLVFDEPYFGIDDENFIKTIKPCEPSVKFMILSTQ